MQTMSISSLQLIIKPKVHCLQKKEDQPVRDRAPAKTFMKEEIVITKDIAVKEENI